MKNSYTAADIDVFEGLEGIKKKPGVYVGDINKTALFQIIKEAVDNCIDEFLVDENTKVYIEIDKENMTVLVADRGRGIPVENHPKTGFSTLTTVLTRIHAGGKFSGKSITSGTHGVGISATNALSSNFEVWTYRSKNFDVSQEGNKTWYYQSFKQGIPQTEVTENVKPPINWKSGTVVKFIPDPEIFVKNYRIPIRRLKEWLSNIKYLCPNLEFVLVVEGKETIYKSKNGLSQWVIETVENNKLSTVSKRFEFTDNFLDVSLQWTNADEEKIHSYVNCCHTPEQGSHFTGFKKALNEAVAPFSNDKYSKDDLRLGLVGIIHHRMKDPTYTNQTKEKLSSDDAENYVKNTLLPLLLDFFQKNKSLTDTILTKAVKIKQARDKFREKRAAIKDITFVKKTSKHVLPTVLLGAPRCKPEERELFICEGKSAQGTLKNARDPRYQEILSLKGKFTNASKNPSVELFKNEDVRNIFTSIGSNQNVKDLTLCDPTKARVGKIIFIPDEDDDGYHIRCLALSLVINYMKELIEADMVYVVNAPLFITSYKDRKYYGNTLENIKSQLPKSANVHITRMKGWGECEASDMKLFAMNPDTRILYKVILTEQCEYLIENIMGKDAVHRKKLLGI